MAFDVAVIGGGTGGVAAALAACRRGMRVVLTEETLARIRIMRMMAICSIDPGAELLLR